MCAFVCVLQGGGCFYLLIKCFASFTLHLPTMETLATVFSFMISLSSGAMEEEWGGGGVLGFTLHTTFDKKRSVSNHMDPPL